MKLTLGTVGPFALPLIITAGAFWLGAGKGEAGPAVFSENMRPERNTFRIAIPTNPPNLDPIEMSDTTSDAVVERICSTLVRFDERLALVPELAEAMPGLSQDGLVYTFRLRGNARFHNGRAVTSEDVRYSLTRLLEPASKRTWISEPILGADEAMKAMAKNQRGAAQAPVKGIETPDPLTVRITLREPNYLFLLFLAMNNAAIVPKEEVERLGQGFGRAPVGCGPFRLVEWKDNDRLTLERWDGYFGEKPSLEKVVFRVMPDEETRFQAYLNGDLDLIEAPFGRVSSIKASNIGAQLLVNPMLDVRYHGINMEKLPLGGNPPGGLSKDAADRARKVRQAMNYAIDRPFLCEVILEGRAVPAKGVIPPGMEAFNPDLAGYRFDPEKAKRLLAEAGYPEGKGLPVILYHFNSQPPNPMVAQAVQEMLRRVGIRTEQRQMDWGAYQNFIDGGGGQFFRLAWIADYPDPENFLYVLFHSKNAGPEGNNARYRDPGNDRRLDDARSCIDPARRLALWREAESKIVEDAPWLFLYHNATALIVKPYVKGLVLTGMDAGPEMQQADLTRVRIEPGAK